MSEPTVDEWVARLHSIVESALEGCRQFVKAVPISSADLVEARRLYESGDALAAQQEILDVLERRRGPVDS